MHTNYSPIAASVAINVLTPPSAPENLLAVVSSGAIALSWVDTSANEAGFQLDRSLDGVTFDPLAVFGANVTACTNVGLPPATTYYYRVSAFNAAGDSDYSNTNGATTPAFPEIKINFQPASEKVPTGYIADTGLVYGNRTNGLIFGWNKKNTLNAKVRDSERSPDARYDTLIYTYKSDYGTVWEIAVPNGKYQVVLVAGDPDSSSGTYKFNVENVLLVNGKASSSQRWVAGTNTVTVADGRLTVSNASGYKDNKVCFIKIAAAP